MLVFRGEVPWLSDEPLLIFIAILALQLGLLLMGIIRSSSPSEDSGQAEVALLARPSCGDLPCTKVIRK